MLKALKFVVAIAFVLVGGSIRTTRAVGGVRAVTRSFFVSAVVVSLLVGCVSLGPGGTNPPTAPPSFGITTPAPATPVVTATPIATPIATPTAAPIETPTSEASTTPAPPLTPAPSSGTIEDFGADTLLFADDFSDDTSGFGVGTNSGGTVAYVNGALQFDTLSQGSWMWSRRSVDTFSNVVHVEASFTPSAFGYQGLLCARSDDELWGAVANANGIWVFIKLTSDGATILTSNQQVGFEITPGATTRIALDCAGTNTGSLRMQLSLPDVGLVATYEDTEGPENFDRVGAYGESSAHPYSLRIDDLFAYGGEGNTTMSPAAVALLQHVPAAWRPDCFETQPNPFESGALASLSCALADGRSDVADFVQFDTKTNMDAAYQARVDAWAVESTATCESGPNEVSYTIGGTPAGRVLCAPQTVGIRADWTHDLLTILTTLTDFDGSYGDAYQDWLIAGPE